MPQMSCPTPSGPPPTRAAATAAPATPAPAPRWARRKSAKTTRQQRDARCPVRSWHARRLLSLRQFFEIVQTSLVNPAHRVAGGFVVFIVGGIIADVLALEVPGPGHRGFI